jgi:glutamine phosphoribosylpyrophosphate amidotransferase
MRIFFRRSKNNSREPTHKELERDFRKVLHGEASGEIMVANESPVLKAGKRKVVDKVGKGKRVVKAKSDEREATRLSEK